MNVPCENSTPNTSAPVSVWVSKCTTPTGPWTVAHARIDGSVIEWSPPSTTGMNPAGRPRPTVDPVAGGEHLTDRRLDRGVRAHRVGRDDGRVAEVDHPQLGEGVDLDLEVRPRR